MLKLNILNEERQLVSNMFAYKVNIEGTIDVKLLDQRINEIRNNNNLQKQLEAERERNRRLEIKIAELQMAGNIASKQEVKKIVNDLTALDWYQEGFNAFEAKDYVLAVNYYTESIKLDSTYVYAFNNRGFVYQNLNTYEVTIRDYNKALELNPQLAETYTNRGLAYKNLGKYEIAIKNYNDLSI